MRAFIAVELSEALQQEIGTLQSELKTNDADVKWVEVGNLHLTLKFLGDIDEAQVESLVEALKPLTSHLSPFTYTLEGVGAFPRITHPRVIWVGVTDGKEALEQLAQGVEEVCGKLRFEKEERPFSAHLTIGRLRSRKGSADLIKKLQVVEFKTRTPTQATQLILFRSTLSPKGPIYTILSKIPLG